MASQAYIIDAEDKLIAAIHICHEVIKAIEIEKKSNVHQGYSERPEGDQGVLSRENRDCWNTLLLNAKMLQKSLAKVIEDLGREL